MEESSEAHMETDVSSTTEDVPEAQEVTDSTASNEMVEMVVIVEKVSEDEDTFSQQSDTQPQVTERDNSKTLSPQTPLIKSQQKVSKSPCKALEIYMSPTKPSPNKALNSKIEAPSLAQSNFEQLVDSSTKMETQKSLLKSNVTSPIKPNLVNIETQNTLLVSPIKDQSQILSKTSPNKVCQGQDTVASPCKEQKSENVDKKDENIENEDNKVDSKEDNTFNCSTIITEKEILNDSQIDINCDMSEKEHNKSISRELKSLINSAKESKIISECTQLTSKTRKSRVPLDASNSSLNTSIEPDKIQEKRRNSDNSQKSTCSEQSDKTFVKRSMRSQNPEFVNKVKQFLNSVTSKVQKESDEGTDDEVIEETKIKEMKKEPLPHLPKKKKVAEVIVQDKVSKLRSDPYCWRCHWAIEQAPNEKGHPPMTCTVCPRSYHYKCLSGAERSKIDTEKSWVCPECMAVLHAESSETRSQAMKKTTLGTLCELLKHALNRMMDLNGVEPFMQPVDKTMFPDYEKYVVHPMDLSLMKQNISASLYGSTEAFLADAQWIFHNSIIFNTLQSKLTAAARTLVRSCRAEMGEIEACPECYAAAHAHKPTWFTDVCSTPHVLLWAKLKGFPYWPAKGMSINSSGLVDVRFFGAHDRAWVPAKDCFLFSEKDPNNFRTKRQDILDSMQEAEQHIRNISRKYGKFVYPPFKTQFDPSKLNEQLKIMIPSFEGDLRSHVKEKPVVPSPSMVKDKRRSNSKSSKGSHHDGDMSEGEEGSAVTSRKMADGAVIARVDDSINEKDKIIEIVVPEVKDETSRKRRRSNLEEAVCTILESTNDKKRKIEEKIIDLKNESQSISSMECTESSQDSVISQNKSFEVKIKDNEPSSSTLDKDKHKFAPIKLVISTKANNPTVVSKPNNKIKGKFPTIKLKQSKLNKRLSIVKNKNKEVKSKRRRRSKSNKSINNSNAKTGKVENKNEKNSESAIVENENSVKLNENQTNSVPEKSADTPKSIKERIQFDDDTSLADLAREAKNSVTNSDLTGMPTISSVRSLSTTAQNTSTTSTKTITAPKSVEVSIETNSVSSIFTHTSTEPTQKETVNKAQTLRSDADQSLVGRVGVRAFARMTAPEKTKDNSKDVEVEIKTEPIDLDDADRHMEKMDLMNAFKLRPVNPTSLREVRINKINKVVMTTVNSKKAAGKADVLARARKTFPQPKKPDDGRSELNSKNSMVYIPIQPPVTPVPVRGARITPVSVTDGAVATKSVTMTSTTGNNVVNTVTTPLVPSSVSAVTTAFNPTVTSASSSTTIAVPTVGHVPTTVHTVPLITSVNGQWTFSLQPIMSVGVDDEVTPTLNGLPESRTVPPSLVPITSTSTSAVTGPVMMPPAPILVPAAPVLVPASASTTHSLLISSSQSMPTTPTTTLSAAPIITPNRIVDASGTPGDLPRLQQRPTLLNPFDSQAFPSNVPVPASAGPLTAKLNQNSVKLMDFFRTLLEDSLEKLDDPEAQATSLKLQLEQTRWRHRQEVEEMKHNYELTVAEMRSSFEKEKARIISEVRGAAQADLESAVKLAKSKQWCANCRQEAQFYCCWNTSYCDYPCQRAHWSQHFAVCTQQRAQDGENNGDHLSTPPESRLQPQPDRIVKNVPPATTPTLTVGGKVATRGDQQGQKSSSIIMSMEKDTNGNPTLKCLGTYKPPSVAPTPMSSILINKQVINNDDSSKKVVTSGGYLIVGAASNPSTPMVTSSRRPHTIQYFT